MGFDVSNGAASAVLYSVLVSFTIIGIGSAGWLNFLPSFLTHFCTLGKGDGTDTEKTSTDHFLSARNSAGVWALALSYFASGMGAWVVYGTTEMGATPQLSWLGVIGYSGASAFPAILIGGLLGPSIRSMTENKQAFCVSDFSRQRYGRTMQVVVGIVSLFYMFIYIVAELTSISNIFALLTNNFSTRYGIGITVSLGAFTIFYTTLAGLPASIVTDKFQGVIMGVLVIILTAAVATEPSNHVERGQFALSSNLTTEGLMALVTLGIAIACAELFNQSNWQRVWAAESVPVMRAGFTLGSVMVFLLMMFFGVMGMIAYALDPESYDSFSKYAFLSLFDLLEPLSNGMHIVVLILVTALAASSVDSLQNGMTCIFAHDIVKIGWNPAWIIRIMMVIVNIPAIYLASKKFDVISLFLVADLVCATSAFPVFLGLQTSDRFSVLKAPTELGAVLGCISGVVTVFINAVVNDTPIFQYFWLSNGAICALCGSKTMVSFIVTPIVSCIMTYVFTFLDILIRGEDRAREPIVHIAFDDETDGEDVDDTVKKLSEGGNQEEDEADNIEVADDVDQTMANAEEGAVTISG